VEIHSLKRSVSHYKGSSLRNGSIGTYLRHILSEIRRILKIDSGWTREGERSRITDSSIFYESIFRPGERERDQIRWWAEGEDP